jgi:hypothetical protein
MKLLVQAKLFFFLLLCLSCSSYEQFQDVTQELEIPSKVYKADYNQAWQAVLLVMRQYDLELQNQESGVIKTRWIDNTVELNFADSFGSSDAVKSARFKIIINVVKGFRSGREVSKISVFKRQMIEQDFLQGWKVIRSDGIQEETILYRISRLIQIDNKLKEIEDQKSKEAEATF